jgi:hypothetical protein
MPLAARGALSRLFISHSSKDNVSAIAFKQWLGANNWPDEDVFLDLDSIGAGERWKEALRNANARCEAIILLASPDALSSPECLAEVRKAEDFGKEIIVVLLHDLQVDDRRLGFYKDRQIVDLAAPPQSHIETVNYRGDRHEIHFNGDALASVKDFLVKRGITPERFAWPPQDRPDAEPFPGLSAFTEDDAGIFFGRDSDILRGLDKLRVLRRNGQPRLLVVQAASGAGKSSYLRAGLWPRLNRDSDFAPVAILRPAQGILTGPEGLGRKLAARLSRPGLPTSPGEVHAKLMSQDAATAAEEFTNYMLTAAGQAHGQRRIGDPEARPPALVLAIDQAEELFSTEDAAESERFLLLLAKFMREPPAGVEQFCLFTIRADGAARLFQTIADLNLEVPETLPLLPLPQSSYRDVILKPLEVVARRGQRLTLSSTLADHLVADATGADALPLLAFSMSQLYREFGVTGSIMLEQYEAMGGVAGSIDMALKQALAKPGDSPAIPASKDEQLVQLRAAFIPWLARVDPESGVPIRRVARLDEFPQNSRAMVERLVKARLLVADRRSSEDVIEVAHESLLRQWPALMAWLQADADDLKLIDAVERAAGEWARNGGREGWLDHRAERLRAAERVATRQDFRKRLGEESIAYLDACRARDDFELRKERRSYYNRIAAIVCLVILALIAALAGPWAYSEVRRQRVVTNEAERRDIRGEIFAYAAVQDQTPLDTAHGFATSPYTTSLLEKLRQHDKSLIEALQDTHQKVLILGHGHQRPLLSTSMNGNIYLWHQPPSRERRAIVVSVDYEGISGWNLQAPKQDGDGISALLHEAGFQNVIRLHNATKSEIEIGVESACNGLSLTELSPTHVLSAKNYYAIESKRPTIPVTLSRVVTSGPDSIIVFYFSGLGLQFGARNFIIPSIGNQSIADERDLEGRAVELDLLRERISNCSAAAVVILDAHFVRLSAPR